jgi:hypothetical protein
LEIKQLSQVVVSPVFFLASKTASGLVASRTRLKELEHLCTSVGFLLKNFEAANFTMMIPGTRKWINEEETKLM